MRDSRRDIIVQLLERHAELVDPVRSGNGGNQGLMLLPPSTYTPTVRELERLLVKLRSEHHSVWWHVNERYLKAETRTRWRCPKCNGLTHSPAHKHRDRRGKQSVYPGVRTLVVVWRHDRVDPRKVERGIGWLAENWGLVSEPMLPRELMVA